jgi:hypothetical protein
VCLPLGALNLLRPAWLCEAALCGPRPSDPQQHTSHRWLGEEDEEDEEDEILLRPFSYESMDMVEVSVNLLMWHQSDNEEEGTDCNNNRDEELENRCITTTTTTTDEEQTRRYSLKTTTTTTSLTPPTPSSSPLTRSGSYSLGDCASPCLSLESTTTSPSSSSELSCQSAMHTSHASPAIFFIRQGMKIPWLCGFGFGYRFHFCFSFGFGFRFRFHFICWT